MSTEAVQKHDWRGAREELTEWTEKFLDWLGRPLPDNYLTFDCETTGLAQTWDLPVEIGHCVVRNRKVVHKGVYILNWVGWPGVETEWLAERFDKVRTAMAEQGKPYNYSVERLQAEGKAPEKVLAYYHKLFTRNRREGAKFVSHNGWAFDSNILRETFSQSCGLIWDFGVDEMFDTGGMEKALRGELEPHPDEHTLKEFFLRVHARRLAGVRWAIEVCVDRYNLLEGTGLTKEDLHDAGKDSFVTHLLFEEHRNAYQ
jgi:DNA polymerase III epsilon subunit-like protein